MDDPQDHRGRFQSGPDTFPHAGGNMFAPFPRHHDVQEPPRRSGAILATTAGVLLVIGLVIWFLVP